MSRVDLLMKLTVDRDRRTNTGEVEQHSVKHAFGVFSDNLRRLLAMNLVYAFIFALPFLFCVFVWPMLAKNYFFGNGNYNFIGQVGIGYPGVVNTMSEGYKVLFEHYFHVYIPVLSASIVPMVFGLSGVFHCMRGYMWGENVRPIRSFFRGIKRLWLPFLVTALVFGAFMCGVLYGGYWHISLLKAGAATAGSWVLFIFLILLTWFAVAILFYLLPTFACYRFKMRDALKNSVLLVLVCWFSALFTAAISIGIFLLGQVGSILNYLIALFFLALGFAFLAGIWMSSAQKAFGNYIKPQFEGAVPGGAKAAPARKGVNPYREAKARNKAQENTAIGMATRKRAEENGAKVEAAPQKRKAPAPTKKANYKRKK
ncbi:MAG: hypothetical protein IJT69_04045 [Clostridia bacterium]|nr:hypothetical protein [Clostridia bacterium]